jgi:hypothetical protein
MRITREDFLEKGLEIHNVPSKKLLAGEKPFLLLIGGVLMGPVILHWFYGSRNSNTVFLRALNFYINCFWFIACHSLKSSICITKLKYTVWEILFGYIIEESHIPKYGSLLIGFFLKELLTESKANFKTFEFGKEVGSMPKIINWSKFTVNVKGHDLYDLIYYFESKIIVMVRNHLMQYLVTKVNYFPNIQYFNHKRGVLFLNSDLKFLPPDYLFTLSKMVKKEFGFHLEFSITVPKNKN